MFSSKESLKKKTGEFGTGRCEFLGQLVNEFHTTKSAESKRQVLANLANFSYDPINYQFLRQHRAIDLFLDGIAEADEAIQEYSIGGLCNLCLDPENLFYILCNNGVSRLTPLLKSTNPEIVCNTLTSLIFLIKPESIIDLQSDALVAQVKLLSSSSNKRISNLARVFIEDIGRGK